MPYSSLSLVGLKKKRRGSRALPTRQSIGKPADSCSYPSCSPQLNIQSLRFGMQWLDSINLPTGHVFPEFKESDAMFAAERVSLPAGKVAHLIGGNNLDCSVVITF